MQVSICCCDVCVSVFGAAVGLECLCSDCQSEVCHSESGACFVEVYIYVPLSLSLFLSLSPSLSLYLASQTDFSHAHALVGKSLKNVLFWVSLL